MALDIVGVTYYPGDPLWQTVAAALSHMSWEHLLGNLSVVILAPLIIGLWGDWRDCVLAIPAAPIGVAAVAHGASMGVRGASGGTCVLLGVYVYLVGQAYPRVTWGVILPLTALSFSGDSAPIAALHSGAFVAGIAFAWARRGGISRVCARLKCIGRLVSSSAYGRAPRKSSE